MTRDQVVELIRNRVGRRSDTALRNLIIAEMDYVQTQILERNSWLPLFLLGDVQSFTTTANQAEVDFPAGCIRPYEEDELFLYQSAEDEPYTVLIKDEAGYLQAKYQGDATIPVAYAELESKFRLFNTPDDTYTLKTRFYEAATSLAGTYGDEANVTNDWITNALDWFMGEVGYIISTQYLQSPQMTAIFDAQRQRGKMACYHYDIARREANVDRRMGDGR